MAGLNRARKQLADATQVEAVRRYFLQWGMHPVTVEQIPDDTLAYYIRQGKTPADIWQICNLVRQPDILH